MSAHLNSKPMNVANSLPEPVVMLDTRMHPWSMDQTVDEIARRMDAGLFTQHVVVNVAKLVNMRRDPGLREAVSGCDIVNIDGMGVVWGARMLGLDVPERVTGIDLFFRLLSLAESRGDSVFFLGAREEVVEKAVNNLRRDYPSLRIAGWHHGYFWKHEEEVGETNRGIRCIHAVRGHHIPEEGAVYP